ncbi:uncharacterized protein METZ01_LOCUS67889 [marine metagenome]|uniref:Uncharacterized protein n=1 Tax=marine metagenome TaxID=408172 RepID=A0A381TFW8_9ZZZZ
MLFDMVNKMKTILLQNTKNPATGRGLML